VPVLANIGLPTIAVYWPLAWAGLLLVVAIEALFGTRTLGLSFRQGVLGAGLANLFSTAIGIPLTWLLLAIPQVLLFGNAAGIDTVWGKVFAVTVQSPWLIPYEEHYSWMVPCALLSLSVPFWLTSAASEWLIVRLLFPTLPKSDLWKWQFQGNAMSYAALCTGMVVALVAGLNWLTLYEPLAPLVEQLMSVVLSVARALGAS